MLNFHVCRKTCCIERNKTYIDLKDNIESVFLRFAAYTHFTHICVSKLTIIGSDNGLSPGRRQAIIWTNAGILLIGPLGTNFSEILIEIHTFSSKKTHLNMSSGKWRPFCLGLNVLSYPSNSACHPNDHHWDYSPCVSSSSQVTATHSKIGYR